MKSNAASAAAISSSSSSLSSKRSEVAASALEYLANEVVAYVVRSCGADAVAPRLEQLGVQVGRRLAERLTREKARFPSDVESVRFVCKEFWQEMTGHTAKGLHRNISQAGMFQVEDASLRFLARISAEAGSTTLNDEALKYVALPCGMIKGALEALGYDATVKCNITTLPACMFVISIKP